MREQEETISITVTGRPDLIEKLKGLMCLLDHAGAVGHSGTFGMSLDGDGPDRLHIEVDGEDARQFAPKGADRIGGAGYHVELSTPVGFSGAFYDLSRESKWAYDHQGRKL